MAAHNTRYIFNAGNMRFAKVIAFNYIWLRKGSEVLSNPALNIAQPLAVIEHHATLKTKYRQNARNKRKIQKYTERQVED